MLQNAEDLKKEVSEENRIEKELKDKKEKEEWEKTVAWYKKHMLEIAAKLVDDYLPKKLRECEKKGIRTLLTPERGYHIELEGINMFDSNRFFEPNSEHCNYVIEELKKFGYNSECVVLDIRNFSYITTADGYDIVDEPGTHEEYQLKITW
jgi:hypothetical protein